VKGEKKRTGMRRKKEEEGRREKGEGITKKGER